MRLLSSSDSRGATVDLVLGGMAPVRWFWGLILVLAGFFGVTTWAEESWALFVGVTEYPHLETQYGQQVYQNSIRLLGPENDVALLQQVVADRFHLRPDHMTVLAGWSTSNPESRPTRAHIERAFAGLEASVSSGDWVFVFMAGHGSQQPCAAEQDASNLDGMELDGLDEIFLPADTRMWSPETGTVEGAIRDDELSQWLWALTEKGAHVWIVLDTCHAGTMTRGFPGWGGERQRGLPPERLGVPDLAIGRHAPLPGFGSQGVRGFDVANEGGMDERDFGRRLVAFFATHPWESAPELPLPQTVPAPERRMHGLFSFALAHCLSQAGSGSSYRALMECVQAFYRAFPRRNPSPFAQGSLDQSITPIVDEAEVQPVLQLSPSTMEVTGGALAGLTSGSVLAVFPSRDAMVTQPPLGYVRVVSVGLDRGKVVPHALDGGLAKWPDDVPEQAPCALVFRDFGAFAVPLGWCGDQADTVEAQSLLQRLREDCRDLVHWVPCFERPEWVLWVSRDEVVLCAGDIALEPGEAEFWLPLVAQGEAIALHPPSRCLRQLTERLQNLYRWRNLCRIPAFFPAQSQACRVGLFRMPSDAARERVAIPSGNCFDVGESAQLRVEIVGRSAYDLTLLALNQDLAVTPFFPATSMQFNRLSPGDRPLVFDIDVTGSPVGQEQILIIGVPARPLSNPMDFSWLAGDPAKADRGAARSIDGSQLDELLMATAFGKGRTRGLAFGNQTVREPEAFVQMIHLESRFDAAAFHLPDLRRQSDGVREEMVGTAMAYCGLWPGETLGPTSGAPVPPGGCLPLGRWTAMAAVVHPCGLLLTHLGLVHQLGDADEDLGGTIVPVSQVVGLDADAPCPPSHARLIDWDEDSGLAFLALHPAPDPPFAGALTLSPQDLQPGMTCRVLSRQLDWVPVHLEPWPSKTADPHATMGGSPQTRFGPWTCSIDGHLVAPGSPALDSEDRVIGIAAVLPSSTGSVVVLCPAGHLAPRIKQLADRAILPTVIHVPQPWRAGTARAEAELADGAHVTTVGCSTPVAFFLDLNVGSTVRTDDRRAAGSVQPGDPIEAEFAFLAAWGNWTFYDTDCKGEFDLVLRDENRDGRSDFVFRRESSSQWRWRRYPSAAMIDPRTLRRADLRERLEKALEELSGSTAPLEDAVDR